MQNERLTDRKYIIGWLTFKPGKRAEFMEIARPYVQTCRAEEGCVFFEMNLSVDDPDVVVVAECFENVEAHRTHLDSAPFRAFWADLRRICLAGRFENIVGGQVIIDSADFGAADPPEVHYVKCSS